MKANYLPFRVWGKLRRVVNKSYNSGKIIPELKEFLNYSLNDERSLMGDVHVQVIIDKICTNLLNEPRMKKRVDGVIRDTFRMKPTRYYQRVIDDIAQNNQGTVTYKCPDSFEIKDYYYPNGKSMAPSATPYDHINRNLLIESARFVDSFKKLEFICNVYEKENNGPAFRQTGEKCKCTYNLTTGARAWARCTGMPSLSI